MFHDETHLFYKNNIEQQLNDLLIKFWRTSLIICEDIIKIFSHALLGNSE